MIAKKIKSWSADKKAKASHARDLADYIRGSDAEHLMDYAREEGRASTGKVAHTGARNFSARTHEGQKSEMAGLALEAARCRNPLTHWIVSWQEGEQPTEAQFEQAVDVFLESLGLQDHQAIFAVHQDTDNIHMHVVLNRVHPTTHRVAECRYDYEDAHRAIAKIEAVQGWKREQHGRYVATSDGKTVRVDDLMKPRSPNAKRTQLERATGEMSAERQAQLIAGPILRSATSWAQVRAELQQHGMRYEYKGSGAIVWIGEVPVKASNIDREAARTAMDRRLGPMPASFPKGRPATAAKLTAIHENQLGWATYRARREESNSAKRHAFAELRARQKSEWSEALERNRRERAALTERNWRKHGHALNALRSVTAAEHASTRAAMRERHAEERRKLRKEHSPWPRYEDWLRDRGRTDAADTYRHGGAASVSVTGLGDESALATAKDIRDYHAIIRGGFVHYLLREDMGAGAAFVDHGRSVEILELSDASLLAGMQLAAAKFGKIKLQGDQATLHRCAVLAARNGIQVTNPELQATVIEQQVLLGRNGQGAHERTVPMTRHAATSTSRTADGAAVQADLQDTLTPTERALALHSADISARHRRKGEPVDVSRVEGMAAVRLRMTGHSAAEVTQALRSAHRRRHGSESVGDAYAERAVRYAYGIKAGRTIQRLEVHLRDIFAVEGRGEEYATKQRHAVEEKLAKLQPQTPTRGPSLSPRGDSGPSF